MIDLKKIGDFEFLKNKSTVIKKVGDKKFDVSGVVRFPDGLGAAFGVVFSKHNNQWKCENISYEFDDSVSYWCNTEKFN